MLSEIATARNPVLASPEPWAMFYRDRLSIPEIAIRLGCASEDLLPELSLRLTDALASYRTSLNSSSQSR